MYTSTPSPTTVVTGHGSTALTGADLGISVIVLFSLLLTGAVLAYLAARAFDR